MNQELNATFGGSLTRLPLRHSADVRQQNALRESWHELFTLPQLIAGEVFIFGNPPFVAKANRDGQQNEDMRLVFAGTSGTGVLDYVCCWLQKAAELIRHTNARAAFVATNSITQGEQVAVLWRRLFGLEMHIDFAHRSFKWTNEAENNAAVFCVIVGFSSGRNTKRLFEYETPTSDPHGRQVESINPYLLPIAERLYVKGRTTPLCDAPAIAFGSMPNDNGHLLFPENEYHSFLREEPAARSLMRPFRGSREFINNITRYCLWLKGADPQKLRRMPHVTRRIRLVAEYRAESTRETTRTLPPSLFGEDRQPNTRYLMIPSVSSERRRYIPMDFQEPNVIASNLCLTVEGATLFHLGILSSAMHMAWVRTVAGRLEARYRYSNKIVYNTFPWPLDVDDAKRQRVLDRAEEVLNVRRNHPNASLADLYDPDVMPQTLFQAHRELDRAVDACYRRAPFESELQRVLFLFELYGQLDTPLVRIRNPNGNSCNVRWVLFYLKPNQLIHIYTAQKSRIAPQLWIQLASAVNYSHLQSSKLTIGNHEEVAAPARRIKEAESHQLVMKGDEGTTIVVHTSELSIEIVYEQRLYHFQDVRLRSVVRPQGMPSLCALIRHHILKHRSEYRRRDTAPVRFEAQE